MRCKAVVLASKATHDGNLAKIQINGALPPEGEILTIRWGKRRSESQNSLYWVYLDWLINDAGLKDKGFFCPDALHVALKSHFLSEQIITKGQFQLLEGSTTDLNKDEFMEYFDKVDHFINDFFEINTQPFWQEYAEMYGKY